jgi:NO-binding membrane sensor protein with MHYT domain/nitrogen-specific signal transduction histidine kinase
LINTYTPWLVALSYFIAVIASFVALSLSTRIRPPDAARASRLWLVIGGSAMGVGMWSMHFIAMLALVLPIPVTYSLPVTLVSLLIGIISSGFALYTSSLTPLTSSRLQAAGVLMGLGIVAMHYTGMAAMEIAPRPSYDPLLLALSVVFAIAASLVALRMVSRLRGKTMFSSFWIKAGAALVMALAISGMHYTGMAAAMFDPKSVWTSSSRTIDPTALALIIGLCTIGLIFTTLLVALYDMRLSASRNRNDALEERVRERTATLRNTNALLMLEIADRKKMEEKLAESMERMRSINHELEQFAYIASHDLQAPLRTIAGFARLLQRQYGSTMDLRGNEYLEHIGSSTSHMQKLISGMLEFSRAGGQMQLDTVECEALLAKALKNLHATIAARGAEITHSKLPAVRGSALELTQVLQNLIGNGIKFQPGPHPKVHVSAARDGDLWHISVADQGIGIADENRNDVFKIFHRLHGDSEYEGSGIGLSICQKIIKLHGGDIWVDSKPGDGSTFHFTLKATEKAAQ